MPLLPDRTPIHIAAQHGHTAIIELLAEKFKVSVFERTKDGSTLMHIASLHGHPDTAMALFRKGVPLQMPNKVGLFLRSPEPFSMSLICIAVAVPRARWARTLIFYSRVSTIYRIITILI
jgi:ankyrin repeat protein